MPTESNTPSALLKARKIYDVLDGDAKFHSNELDEDVNLPYQSGPMLVETLSRFVCQAHTTHQATGCTSKGS